jgi:hypothetical protein
LPLLPATYLPPMKCPISRMVVPPWSSQAWCLCREVEHQDAVVQSATGWGWAEWPSNPVERDLTAGEFIFC